MNVIKLISKFEELATEASEGIHDSDPFIACYCMTRETVYREIALTIARTLTEEA